MSYFAVHTNNLLLSNQKSVNTPTLSQPADSPRSATTKSCMSVCFSTIITGFSCLLAMENLANNESTLLV